MSAKLYRKQSIKRRLMKGTFILAAVLSLLILSYTSMERSMLLNREPQNMDELLEQVQLRGGSLVRCKRSQCFDMRTEEFVGSAGDGLYITYPDGAVSEAVLRQQQMLVQKFLGKP
jgi:hypothetical protein